MKGMHKGKIKKESETSTSTSTSNRHDETFVVEKKKNRSTTNS
jgi:hypothetical protein